MDLQEIREIGKQLLRIIPLVTLISAGIMSLVFGLLFGTMPYLRILVGSFVYTTVFSAVMVTAFRQLDARRPPVNARNIATHLVILSPLSLLCYGLASWLITTIYGEEMHGAGSDQIISFLLTMMITVAVLGVFYVQLFLQREKEARQQMVKAELAALKAQINPHFLFNSLNSIAALSRIDAAKSEQVTEDLADLFRYSLRASGRETVSLREELAACELYLAIERARFGERLQVRHEIEEEILTTSVPALILQPLVENAVKHGLQQTPGDFTLLIEVKNAPEGILISVTDSGPGMDPAEEAAYLRKGTGLSNVQNRLRLQFGNKSKIKVMHNGICLILPVS
ncbi:two-component system, LytT family, sensor histidine kinase AlgZ [Cyclonatronum proteinivorum]|uniref:Two-component system, LytT family, sensor histidine kinase AlgZ n=1 Tax=Cyclonatronum proteinivorum TaxID=1457365 RepID=A0A345UFX0_9BACT|nr:histidine kinase [Cyclonatronum proteinivorum]AXI99371.1 two-component system, LytT family, sensor histidine kinase AlgZ [Cyclonatronum proteinivorum]